MFPFVHRLLHAKHFARYQLGGNPSTTQLYYSRRASVKLTPHDVSLIHFHSISPCFKYKIIISSQVNLILNANEFNKEFSDSIVKSYDSNQVASNNPLEDRRSEATCLHTNGLTFSFDCNR